MPHAVDVERDVIGVRAVSGRREQDDRKSVLGGEGNPQVARAVRRRRRGSTTSSLHGLLPRPERCPCHHEPVHRHPDTLLVPRLLHQQPSTGI